MEVKACDQQYAWEFVDPPPQDYYCPLCEKILKEPKLTDCCGSHFCTACINPIITAQKPCPNPECRKEQFQSMIDKRTMNRILELDVLCPLKGRGCHWKGEMGMRDKHLDPKNENSCEYIDVKCTHGCGEDMEKYELAEHLNRFCPKRPHKCEHCDFEDVFDRIVKDHHPVCPKYPLPCHNNCGNEEIPRSDYEQHLSECPHQDIECEFRYAGCVERIKRKDIAQHQQEGVYVHLSLQTAFATQQLTERDRKIEEMSTTWENKHQHLTGDIEKLFHRCEEESKEREENSKRLKVELAQKDEAIERLSAQLHEKEKVIEEMQVRFSKFQEDTDAKVEQFVAKEIIEVNIKRQAIEVEAKLLESQEDSQKKVSKQIERSVEVAKDIKHTVRKQIKEVSDTSNTRADKLNKQLQELDEKIKAVEQSLTVSRSTVKQNSATSINNTKIANSVAPAKETIGVSVLAATAMSLTTVPQSVYDIMSPDALALLEKLPIGQIEGVYYNPKAGKVFIEKESAEKEDERITKFQTAYQSILSRKVKTIEVPIPATMSPDALANLVHQYNQTYDLCVFSVQEGEFPCVKIVSTSSRQHDQARTLLANELVEIVSPILPAVSKCEVIHLSKTQTLTLKKANIVEEEVDIIVNPANERLAHGGGVAAALNKASKGQLQKLSKRHVENKGTVTVGKIAITSGGGALKCDKVIHAVGPDTGYGEAECERLLTKVITEALKGAEKYNANSIAFPAISTGIFGVRKELVARCLVDTVMAYHFTKPHPVLSDIRIVIIDEKTYAPFARYFQQKMAALEISKIPSPLIQPTKFKAPASTPTSPPPVADKETQLAAPEPAAPPGIAFTTVIVRLI